MFKKISIEEILGLNEEILDSKHKGILNDLVSTLEEDLGRPVELGIRCKAKFTSGWASHPKESFVVQPRYVIRDSKIDKFSRKPIIFEAGDGNIGGSLFYRISLLLGLRKEFPWGYRHFGHTYEVNENYFQEGSKSREIPYIKDFLDMRSRFHSQC